MDNHIKQLLDHYYEQQLNLKPYYVVRIYDSGFGDFRKLCKQINAPIFKKTSDNSYSGSRILKIREAWFTPEQFTCFKLIANDYMLKHIIQWDAMEPNDDPESIDEYFISYYGSIL